MKSSWIALSLILIFVQLPFGDFKPKTPEEKKTPVKGWWMISYFGVSPTRYSKAGKGIIKAESVGSRASLYKEVAEKEKDFSVLSWRWKISNVVRSAVETKKDRFDAAARVMVVFGSERGSKVMEGTEPSGFRIEYIWASHLPKGHIFDHPGVRYCKVFVLESGERKAGEWIFEKRNLHTDYRKAFGSEPSGVLAIGIQTDTDHSNEMVTAYYSNPILKTK
jgi:Protein of unknown function (DUF3047)